MTEFIKTITLSMTKFHRETENFHPCNIGKTVCKFYGIYLYIMRFPLVRGIHQWPVDSRHKGQWLGALMFSLIFAWSNSWAKNREADDLRCHRAHYYVTVMMLTSSKGTLKARKRVPGIGFPSGSYSSQLKVHHKDRFMYMIHWSWTPISILD